MTRRGGFKSKVACGRAVPRVPRIVVAGASSGVGKTSVACGVVRALRGAAPGGVQAFKVGPDYIDTAYLAEASGRPAANLDSWMMGRAGVVAEHDAAVAASGAGVSVVEGVMGYYDGSGDGAAGEHSTYHIARAIGAPVALVVDASRAGQSVAATALGFKRYRRNSGIAGVILNRVGSRRHEAMCRAALEWAGLRVLGAVPRDPSLAVGSGRLGLMQARHAGGGRIGRIARVIAGHLDAGALLGIARSAVGRRSAGRPGRGGGGPPAGAAARGPEGAGPTICVARDEAFGLYYHNSLENLRGAGASVRFFSPVSGRRLPGRCDMLYIGGGFPEEHAAELEANSAMRGAVREFALGGGHVYAEGGGAAYLSRSLEYEKRSYAMAGVLDCDVAVTSRLRLGYVGARLGAGGCIMAPGGAAVRGHAFHHMEARNIGRGARFAYDIDRGPAMLEGRRRRRGRGGDGGQRAGRDGLAAGNALASMMQVYIGPAAARRIVRMLAGPAPGRRRGAAGGPQPRGRAAGSSARARRRVHTE